MTLPHAFIRPAYEWVISPTGRDGPQILFNYRNTSLYLEMNVRCEKCKPHLLTDLSLRWQTPWPNA